MVLKVIDGRGNTDSQEDERFLPPVDWKAIATLTSLVIFFSVFFGSQCYARLHGFWDHCIGLGGTCMNFVALVRNKLPTTNPVIQWNAGMHNAWHDWKLSPGMQRAS